MRMTRPRTMSELSSFPAVTKRKLIESNTETNKSKNTETNKSKNC